jgi:hypothetical protein
MKLINDKFDKQLWIALGVALACLTTASVTCSKCKPLYPFEYSAALEVIFNIVIGLFSAAIFWVYFSWHKDKKQEKRLRKVILERYEYFRQDLLEEVKHLLVDGDEKRVLEEFEFTFCSSHKNQISPNFWDLRRTLTTNHLER